MLDKAKAILGLDSSLNGLLAWALFWSKPIRIDYYSPHNEEFTNRRVIVTRIWREEGKKYFDGYCCLRNERRCFRVDCVVNASRARKSKPR